MELWNSNSVLLWWHEHVSLLVWKNFALQVCSWWAVKYYFSSRVSSPSASCRQHVITLLSCHCVMFLSCQAIKHFSFCINCYLGFSFIPVTVIQSACIYHYLTVAVVPMFQGCSGYPNIHFLIQCVIFCIIFYYEKPVSITSLAAAEVQVLHFCACD